MDSASAVEPHEWASSRIKSHNSAWVAPPPPSSSGTPAEKAAYAFNST